MENKCIKKSTMNQIKTLVDYMEENPEFAKGVPVFGATKFSSEEKWKQISQKLNSIGPPARTILEWKKAHLKSRTKKKIAANKKSLQETGGGLYRMTSLSELEQSIDRRLLLSSAAAPEGREFGYAPTASTSAASQSIEDCFQLLGETPTKKSKAVAVITPSRLNADSSFTTATQQNNETRNTVQEGHKCIRAALRRRNSDDQQSTFSSAKKRKTIADDQLSVIRRQLRVAEGSAATAKELAVTLKRIAEAAELLAESAKRQADNQTECTKALLEVIQRMERILENLSLKIFK